MFGLVCLMVLFPGEYGLAGFSFWAMLRVIWVLHGCEVWYCCDLWVVAF